MLVPLWLLVGASLICASLYPQGGEFFVPYLKYGLMVLIFIGSLRFDIKEFSFLKNHLGKIFFVFLTMHLFSGLLLWFAKSWFALDVFSGLILAAIAPCGMATIFFVNFFGGNTAIAVILTLGANLLSPLLIPVIYNFLTGLFSSTMKAAGAVQLEFWPVFQSVAMMVILPMIAAIWVKTAVKDLSTIFKAANFVSTILNFLMSYAMISPAVISTLTYPLLTLELFFIVLFLVGLQFLVGYSLSAEKSVRLTLALASSYKNFTLAMILAGSFISPKAMLAAIIYALVNNLQLASIEYFFILKKVKNTPKTESI